MKNKDRSDLHILKTPVDNPIQIVGVVGHVEIPHGLRVSITCGVDHISQDAKRRFYKNWDGVQHIKKVAQDCAKANGEVLNQQDLAYLTLFVQKSKNVTDVKALMSGAYNDYMMLKDRYLDSSDYPRAQILEMQPGQYAKVMYDAHKKCCINF